MKAVVDSSVVLAYLFGEPGGEMLATAMAHGSVMSSVNKVEVVNRQMRDGVDGATAVAALSALGLPSIPFDEGMLEITAAILPFVKQANLSLGDCICLATAKVAGLPALTADRRWQEIESDIGVEVILIR
jgi:ribonuclease VapC